jgi:micrococcal nuclease
MKIKQVISIIILFSSLILIWCQKIDWRNLSNKSWYFDYEINNQVQNNENINITLNNGPKNCEYTTIKRTIDWDTFETIKWDKVRMIWIDTPETVHPTKWVEFFGKEASNKLKELIEWKEVCLTLDQNKTMNKDKYNRLLRYVWIENKNINAEMIKEWYAFAYTYFPFQYIDEFREYQQIAKNNNSWLWNNQSKETFKELEKKDISNCWKKTNTVCSINAKDYLGQHKTIRFEIKNAYDTGKIIFLNSKTNYKSKTNFTAIIFEDNRKNFENNLVKKLKNKTIEVTWEIIDYKWRLEIILNSQSQLKIIE